MSQQAYDSPEKKALLTRRTIARMHESLSISRRSVVGMDKGGIQIGHLGRGYHPHPTTMRKVIQDWSIRRAGGSRGHMQQYRELGNELDKNYHYERILSTSTGSSGSSGI
ncbi:hypothetical protein V8E54_009567 [Elaphomyces granulatus]